MKAGRLDRRISIITPAPTQNAFGEEINSWSTFATVWAELKYAGGNEAYPDNQFVSKVDTVFRIRWSNTVKPLEARDRVIFDNRIFDIVAVHEIGRREGLELFAYTRGEYQTVGAGTTVNTSNAIVWNGKQLVWG